MSENERKVLLSLKNVDVKFNVRGRILSAIRNVSLDIYENESLAIVGESGSGKSVLTKTFAGMLDSNGFISNGSIVFSDDELSKTQVMMDAWNKGVYKSFTKCLNKYSTLARGAAEYREYMQLKESILQMQTLTSAEQEEFSRKTKSLQDSIVDKRNYLQTLDAKLAEDVPEIAAANARIAELQAQLDAVQTEKKQTVEKRKADYAANKDLVEKNKARLKEILAQREAKIAVPDDPSGELGLEEKTIRRNKDLAAEVVLSIGRYPKHTQLGFMNKLRKAFRLAFTIGEDIDDPAVRNRIFETVAFRVELRDFDEDHGIMSGYAIIDCSKVKYTRDWQQIRGCRIATVFQDPMTSLNPVVTIGKQIMTVILKHQKCSQEEAKARTIDIMGKVGIPDPESRFNDYPFQYSGGMRQRIVIAIALSCQPKILICDEPTTALDVTIQAQIIRLIKDLQKELGFTTVYITHDLGVVANVAERVAVLYAGQIVEIGKVDEIFYEPRHPYTWALLSSLTQLAEKGTELFSIPGTPPSLYNKIVGDAFAPRNKYAMAIDLVEDPPMFKVSDTHYAKTWLLDPRAPKVEPPSNIQNLHEKMMKSFVEFED